MRSDYPYHGRPTLVEGTNSDFHWLTPRIANLLMIIYLPSGPRHPIQRSTDNSVQPMAESVDDQLRPIGNAKLVEN
jgi:hypothetical protein